MSAAGTLRSAGFRIFVVGILFLLAFAPVGAFAGEKFSLEVANAEASFDQRTKVPIISIKWAASSARRFAEFTSRNVGKATELRLDGNILAKPVIREPILGGSMQISGDFTVEQTQDIASRLVAGTNVEIEIVE